MQSNEGGRAEDVFRPTRIRCRSTAIMMLVPHITVAPASPLLMPHQAIGKTEACADIAVQCVYIMNDCDKLGMIGFHNCVSVSGFYPFHPLDQVSGSFVMIRIFTVSGGKLWTPVSSASHVTCGSRAPHSMLSKPSQRIMPSLPSAGSRIMSWLCTRRNSLARIRVTLRSGSAASSSSSVLVCSSAGRDVK
jgi:hypothetical protein